MWVESSVKEFHRHKFGGGEWLQWKDLKTIKRTKELVDMCAVDVMTQGTKINM